MKPESMEPYGQALHDYHCGDVSAAIQAVRDDGSATSVPAAVFFRKPADFSPIERAAQGLCRGYVLDAGAGAGCHSLPLQERGLKVLAIDISPQAVELMSQRGVTDARRINLFDLGQGRFDTILMMLHGIGMVENTAGLDRFLRHARSLLAPGGQIVFDSLDVRRTDDPKHLSYQEANRKAGRYFGEIRLRFEYRGRSGPPFGWLHVDPETLGGRARSAGFSCRVIAPQADGNYLAQLLAEPQAEVPAGRAAGDPGTEPPP